MHSHHSHSGDYISHAAGTLEEMVATAQKRGFSVYCLTEHMPRLSNHYLYPEELEKNYTTQSLDGDFERYLAHARQLQASSSLKLLVGFELEGIDEAHIEAALAWKPKFDMCVGLVHFVHGIPIDFNSELWLQARSKKDGLTRTLYRDYFDLQYKVLVSSTPEVVGHFDLIRLFEPTELDPTTGKLSSDLVLEKDWPEVWSAITRNIDFVVGYGGLFELNSAAIRKGWSSPYPRADIAFEIKARGGKFCLSDDAHTTAQVGLNYHKVWTYVTDTLQLDTLYNLDIEDGKVYVASKPVSELSKLQFWHTNTH